MPAADNHPAPSSQSRATLRSYFRSGNLPTQQNFYDLIESMVNRVDDDAAPPSEPAPPPLPTPGAGGAAPAATTGPVVFYPSQPAAGAPAWRIGLQAGEAPALTIEELAPPTPPASWPAHAGRGEWPGLSRVQVQAGGQVGIGTTTPGHQLEVSGFVASQGRLGTYTDAQYPGTEVPADGHWHPILRGLDGLHAFELVAAAYGPGRGRYAVTHATVLGAYGTGRNHAVHSQGWLRGLFRRIQFRWTGRPHDYGLDIRTARSFGADARLVYHITHLFDDRRPAGLAPLG